MDERWKDAARQGDIDALYKLIEEDPELLKKIDEIPYVDTPLHIAASFGCTHFAIEVLRLIPSFGRKLNPNGLSPLHLALQKYKELAQRADPADNTDRATLLTAPTIPRAPTSPGTPNPPSQRADPTNSTARPTPLTVRRALTQLITTPIPLSTLAPVDCAQLAETVRQLIKIDSELIRVQGKESITPLHYAAETDNSDVLAEFLCACPASIEDLTIRRETTMHIAVRNHSSRALEVLLGFLRWTRKENMLNCKDENGDTVLHVAASTNQPQVVEMLINKVNKKEKNSHGLTALDINGEVADIIRGSERNLTLKEKIAEFFRRKALTVKDSPAPLPDVISHAEFLKSQELWHETMTRLYLLHRGRLVSPEVQNALLVVAVLIVTATYQALINPPGWVWQADLNTPISKGSRYHVGKIVLRKEAFRAFMFFNSTAFLLSLVVILLTVRFNLFSFMLFSSLVFLVLSYCTAVRFISQWNSIAHSSGIPFFVFYCLLIIKYLNFMRNFRREKNVGPTPPRLEMRRKVCGW